LHITLAMLLLFNSCTYDHLTIFGLLAGFQPAAAARHISRVYTCEP